MSHANISLALRDRALEAPARVAMHYPGGRTADGRVAYRSISYAELERDVAAAAAGLTRIGIGRGVRAALMVKPGPEFFVLMFGLMRAGAVPVLIDPGIARSALKQCLDEAAPEAFIGIPLAQLARIVLGWARGSVRISVTLGRRWFWRGYRYRDVLRLGSVGAASAAGSSASLAPTGEKFAAEAAPTEARTEPDDLAAILFTSGSTGVPKGVEYLHRHFAAQVELIRRAFDIQPGEVDVPTFPPFALFDPALGMTTVLPQMDFARPAQADPELLAQAIEQFSATMMFGSPALVDTLSRWAQAKGRKLPSLKRVLSAGAPVRPDVVERTQAMLAESAEIWTPYGATECLPLALVEGREILAAARERTARGAGILVGRPLRENTVRVIAISDEPIERWSDTLLVPAGAVGEITVAGPTTTQAYFRRDGATRLAKTRESFRAGANGAAERIVHRMGDLGYFDEAGRLWYCGRKSHRVETAAGPLYSEQVEGIFNVHAEVARTALVGVGQRGRQAAIVCVELRAGVATGEWPRIERELRTHAEGHEIARAVKIFLRHRGFPVDIRHNAKIGRERLAQWAARKTGTRE